MSAGRMLRLLAVAVLVAGCDGGSEGGGGSAAAAPLPVLSVATAGGQPVLSREHYVDADWQLEESGAETVGGELEIRGRGNSTWNFPKKPYRLKLAEKTGLLAMPADRHWVLLANYSDKSLLRNAVAFELSRRLGFAWTPRSRHVELWLNDSYEGVYQLVEHVRPGEYRVPIAELKASDTAPEVISGGYLIEVDERRDGDYCLDGAHSGMVFCVASPEDLDDERRTAQRDYIGGYLAATEAALFGADFADPESGYAAFLDVDSTVDYYLAQEITRNVDGDLRLSTWLYKPRGGRLTFGPLWDFDIALGNADYDDAWQTDGWHARRAPWFTRLFEDPAFVARVRARWRELYDTGELAGLRDWTDAEAARLAAAQQRNFVRWPILGEQVWPNPQVAGTWRGEVRYLQRWLRERIAWMDTQLR